MEELSAAAHQVMQGDLDVKIEIRGGGRVRGAEARLPHHGRQPRRRHNIHTLSRRGCPGGAGNAGVEAHQVPYHSLRNCFRGGHVLALGVVGFIAFNRTQNKLIDESMDKMVQITVDSFSTGSNYVRETLDTMVMEALAEQGLETAEHQGSIWAIHEQAAFRGTEVLRPDDQGYGGSGRYGHGKSFHDPYQQPYARGAAVVVSSDESLVYQWEIPDYLLQAIEDGVPYLYLKDGVPELGLQGEYVIAIQNYDLEGFLQAYIGIRPMHKEIMEMQGFYTNEKRGIYHGPDTGYGGIHHHAHPIELPVVELPYTQEHNQAGGRAFGRGRTGQCRETWTLKYRYAKARSSEDLKVAFREIVDTFRKLIARSTGDS